MCKRIKKNLKKCKLGMRHFVLQCQKLENSIRSFSNPCSPAVKKQFLKLHLCCQIQAYLKSIPDVVLF